MSSKACPHAAVLVAGRRGFTVRADWHILAPGRGWFLVAEVYAEPGSTHTVAGSTVRDGATETVVFGPRDSPTAPMNITVETRLRLGRTASTTRTLRPTMDLGHPREGWCSLPT